MSIDDSLLVNRYTEEGYMFEDQEEVNENSLWLHDQREFLDSISDKHVSKYDIEYYLKELSDSSGAYWAAVLREIISHFKLNTLKFFLDDELTSDRIRETIELVRFLKIKLADIMMIEQFPQTRDEILKFMEKNNAPGFIIFAMNTVDRDDLESFKLYWNTFK